MLTPQLRVGGGPVFSRGLGWALDQHMPGITIFGHGGNNGQVFKTFGVGDASARRAIVMFTNGGGGNDICPRIVRAATGIDVLDFVI